MGSGASNQTKAESVEDISTRSRSSGKNKPSLESRPKSTPSIPRFTTDDVRDVKDSSRINNRREESTFNGSSADSNVTSTSQTKDTLLDKKPRPRNLKNIEDLPLHSKGQAGSQHVTTVSTLVPRKLNSLKDTSNPTSEKETQNSLLRKIKDLEEELAASESLRLDLQDQMHVMLEKVKDQDIPTDSQDQSAEALKETVHAKDLYILKLERDIQSIQTESNKMRLKFKKRIRGLSKQLYEVRQESSINQMELKGEIVKQKDQIAKLSLGPHLRDTDANSSDSSHSKIIVELSNQLSEQSEKISLLESQLIEKEKKILELGRDSMHFKEEEADGVSEKNGTCLMSTSGDRLHSSHGTRDYKVLDQTNRPTPSVRKNRPSNLTQSTALSDSDSDWEVDTAPSHTRSAPPHTRVKSALSSSGGSKAMDIGGNLHGDDDSLMECMKKTGNGDMKRRVPIQKKSALKNSLEKKKANNETSSLIGPSLAFATNRHEPPSDTSCEPTPRYRDPSKLPGFSKLTVVHPVHR